MLAALEVHNAALHRAVGSQRPQVFKIIGDAFPVAFAQPAEAIAAAFVAQHDLQQADWGALGPLRTRRGLHLGPTELKDSDYAASHTLNWVAPIMSAGHGGQILLLIEVAEQVQDALSAGVTLRDVG